MVWRGRAVTPGLSPLPFPGCACPVDCAPRLLCLPQAVPPAECAPTPGLCTPVVGCAPPPTQDVPSWALRPCRLCPPLDSASSSLFPTLGCGPPPGCASPWLCPAPGLSDQHRKWEEAVLSLQPHQASEGHLSRPEPCRWRALGRGQGEALGRHRDCGGWAHEGLMGPWPMCGHGLAFLDPATGLVMCCWDDRAEGPRPSPGCYVPPWLVPCSPLSPPAKASLGPRTCWAQLTVQLHSGPWSGPECPPRAGVCSG